MKRLSLFLPIAALAFACDTEDPTMVAVNNDYPTDLVVAKAWWASSYFPDAVAPASEGEHLRTVPSTDFAYVVVAAGSKLIAMKSLAPLHVKRGDVLHIHVSDATFTGNCFTGHPLSQDDADFITSRIFPGEFDGIYDAATCTFFPAAVDGGVDAGGNR